MLRRGPRNCCLALALLATAGVAQAASFDCNKASTKIEYAICRDPALSQLDGELGTVYRARLAQDSSLRRAQIAWIRDRSQRCGPDVARMTRMLTEAFSAACSFNPASEVARCLVKQMHECGNVEG